MRKLETTLTGLTNERAAWGTGEDGLFQLYGSVCGECGKISFPPTCDCADCGAYMEDPRAVPLAGTGTLYAYTTVYAGQPEFDVPYVLGLVDTPEGIRIVAQIQVAEEPLTLGGPVAAASATVRREQGRDVAGYCFRTVTSPRHVGTEV